MPSFEELNYFAAVSRTENVSRAAELCGISQPALSHALKRLEAELGLQLVIREKTGVRLTKAGQRFAIEAKDLVERWKTLSTQLKYDDGSVSGHFKIGCHPSVAIYSLPSFLPALLAAYPELEVSLHHGRSRDIANDIIEWRLDLGLVINPPLHPDLVLKELAQDEVTLWTNGSKKNLETLILEPGLFQSQNILKQLAKKKIRFTRRIESTSLEVIRALTADGCGVGLLPTRVAKTESKQLKRLFPKGLVVQDRLFLAYRRSQVASAAGRHIIEAILRAKI
jgi:DNA-binding transcriptional LysR family regulator